MRTCRDKNIQTRIFGYIDRDLDARSAAQVAGHLETCPDCRKLEQDYRQIIAGLKAALEEEAANHAANEVLIGYVDNPKLLSDEDTKGLELHLTVCPLCRQKVEMLRGVTKEEFPDRSVKISDRLVSLRERLEQAFGHRTVVSVAAAAVLVVAVGIVYWMAIGDRHGQLMQVASRGDVLWLSESIRGTRDLPEVLAGDGKIHVGVTFYAFFDEESYLIQLESPGGSVLTEIPVREEDYNGHGIPLQIEASSLDPGEYRLILVSHKLATGETGARTGYRFRLLNE